MNNGKISKTGAVVEINGFKGTSYEREAIPLISSDLIITLCPTKKIFYYTSKKVKKYGFVVIDERGMRNLWGEDFGMQKFYIKNGVIAQVVAYDVDNNKERMLEVMHDRICELSELLVGMNGFMHKYPKSVQGFIQGFERLRFGTDHRMNSLNKQVN